MMVERMCGDKGSETADTGASSIKVNKTLQWRSSCRYLHIIPVLSQRAVAVEIVLYKAHQIYMYMYTCICDVNTNMHMQAMHVYKSVCAHTNTPNHSYIVLS